VTLILTFFELYHCNSRLYKCSATQEYTLANFVSYPHSVCICADTGSNMFTIMLCIVYGIKGMRWVGNWHIWCEIIAYVAVGGRVEG